MGIMLLTWPGRVEAAVVINEILANPKGDDNKTDSNKEWVEVYNSEGTDLNTEGWYFKDQSNNKKVLNEMTVSVSVDKKFLVYYVKEIGGWLNNSGDTVEVYDKDGKKIDGYSYSDSKSEEVSWGRYPDGGSVWALMQSVTPGSGNSGSMTTPTLSPTPTANPSPTTKPTEVITNTPTPTKPVATVTKVPTAIPSVKKEVTLEAGTSGQISPSGEGEVLGENTDSPLTVTPTVMQEATATAKGREINWLAIGLVGGGTVMLGAAGIPMWRSLRKGNRDGLLKQVTGSEGDYHV